MRVSLFALLLAQGASLVRGGTTEESTVYVTICTLDFISSSAVDSGLPAPATQSGELELKSTTANDYLYSSISFGSSAPSATQPGELTFISTAATDYLYSSISSGSPAPSATQLTESVVTTTKLINISSCAPTVTDCPYTTKPVTETSVLVYTVGTSLNVFILRVNFMPDRLACCSNFNFRVIHNINRLQD